MECPVCFDVYKRPLLLPECGHTICQACAEMLISDSNFLRCPECRFTYQLHQGIKSLPCNVALQRVIDERQHSSGYANLYCEQHPCDVASLYCKTCEKSICLKCFFSSKGQSVHNDHDVDTSEDAFSQEMCLLDELKTRSEKTRNKEMEYISELEKKEHFLAALHADKLAMIEKHKNDMLSIVKATAAKLKFTLKDNMASDRKYLQMALSSAKERLVDMETVLLDVESVFKRTGKEHVNINALKQAKQKLNRLNHYSDTPRPDQESFMLVSSFDTSLESLLQNQQVTLSYLRALQDKSWKDDRTLLFSSWSKLYRFIDSQWKEHGIGTIKILYNAMLGRTRVMMQHDQVHKVCANHLVQPGATITYKDEEKKTLLWSALDFTDDDGPQMENFCCRFKTADTAAQFKDMYEQAKGLSGTSDSTATTDQSPGGVATASSDKSAEKFVSLSALFGAKAGSWECDMCLLRNPVDVTVCPACATPKPGSEAASQEKEKQPVAAINMSAGGGLKFPAAGGMSAQFGAVAFSSTPVKSNKETSSFHTPVTFSFGTPAVSSSHAVVSGQSYGQTQGVTTDKPSPAATLFGKKDAETKQPPLDSNQTVPASLGFTGVLGQQVAVSTATALVSSALATSFTFGAQSTSGTKALLRFGTSKFGETISSASKMPAQSSTTETKTVIGGFSFVRPTVTQTVAVTKTTPVKASVKVNAKPNPFAMFSVASLKAEVVSTASDAGPVKPFSTFGSTATSAKPIFGGFGAAQPTVPGGSTSASALPIFSSAISAPVFGSTVSTTETTGASSIFGGTTAALIFGSANTGANTFSMFGIATPAQVFGSARTADNPTSDTNGGMTFGSSASAVPFVSVAAKGESPDAFSKKSESATVFKLGTGKLFFAEDDNSGEGTQEHLAAKFKTPEITIRFKDMFEDCVKQAANASWDPFEKTDSTTEDNIDAGMPCGNLSDMFLLKNGEWQCDVCFVKNVATAAQCAACMTPRPSGKVTSPSKSVATSGLKGGTLKLAELLSASESEEPTGNGGKEQSLAELFRTKVGEWECDACLVKNKPGSTKCAACETPKPGSKQEATPTVSSSVSSSNPLNISSTGGFSFGGGNASKSVTPTGF